MALKDLFSREQQRAYRELERLLDHVWGHAESSASVPPLDQRISLSITKTRQGGFVPCIHVDREDSRAFKKASEILANYPFVKIQLGGGEAPSTPCDDGAAFARIGGQPRQVFLRNARMRDRS
jgi:hypothetical protein